MREIKFRAYDSETESFIYSDQTYDDAWFEFKNEKLKAFAMHGMDAGTIYEPPQPICDELEDPQEYTGIKDRNGKEIYEGDIIRPLNLNGCISDGVIKFRHGCFIALQISGEHYEECLGNLNNDHIVIIGNIYENPELLNGDK
jgi:uncharacterized phage protein (TIGR01671 family)